MSTVRTTMLEGSRAIVASLADEIRADERAKIAAELDEAEPFVRLVADAADDDSIGPTPEMGRKARAWLAARLERARERR